jgi:general secretion pathway protein D
MPNFYYLVLILLFFCSSCATTQKAAERPRSIPIEKKAQTQAEARALEIGRGEKDKEKTLPPEIPRLPGYETTAAPKAAQAREPIDPKRLVMSKEPVMINVERMPLSNFIIHALGETLKVSFVMDQKVMDRRDPVTVRMTKPVSPEEALERVLGLFEKYNLFVETSADSLYILTKAPDAKQPVDIRMGGGLPEGTEMILQVVPLRYIRPPDVEGLIREIYKTGVQARSYPKENVLILVGQAFQVKQVMEFIQAFDVPFLQEKKTAFIKLTYWQIDDFVRQISQVLEGMGFNIAKASKEPGILFIPVKPISSILIVAPDEKTLSYILQWKEKLDTPEAAGADEKPFVYNPKYTTASDLVKSIRNLYGILPPTTASREADAQVGPPAQLGPPTQTAPAAQARTGSQTRTPTAQTRTPSAATGAGSLKISSDDQKNLIMVLATPTEYRNILGLLQELDVAPRQVLIEATVAELTLTDELKLGLEWFYRNSMAKGVSVGKTVFSVPTGGPGFVYQFLANSANFNVVINAYALNDKVNILATPSLMVLDNHEATIQVGTDVPIITGETSAADIGTAVPTVFRNIQYRNTGVILRVKPTINTEGLLTLNISQEVSEVGTNPPGIDSPTILTRRINTTVVAAQGETIVLGGLISENKSKVISKVPFLGDIPLLGYLFKTTSDSIRKIELVVFLKPVIITKVDQASKMTDEILREMKWLTRP